MGPRRDQRGLNLIEVLIALGILGVIGPALLIALNTNSRSTAILGRQVVGANLAAAHLEAIKSCAYADNYPNAGCLLNSIAIPAQYIVTIDTDCSTDGGATWLTTCSGQTLQKITVAVSQEGRPAFSVGTYRTMR